MQPEFLYSLKTIAYIIASATFIIGLKRMGNAKTARSGNLIAAAGMTLAIIASIFIHVNKTADGYETVETSGFIYTLIFAAIVIGTIIGWLTAKKVQMTKMPELVSMFNGMGGACAALIGLMEYQHNIGSTGALISIIAGLIIGSVSFSGSVIAYLKLNGTMNKPLRLPAYNIINTLFMVGVALFGAYIVYTQPTCTYALYTLFVTALIYGVLFTIPIGGADMPVVISLLNSF